MGQTAEFRFSDQDLQRVATQLVDADSAVAHLCVLIRGARAAATRVYDPASTAAFYTCHRILEESLVRALAVGGWDLPSLSAPGVHKSPSPRQEMHA